MVRELSKEEFDPKKLDIPQQESTFKRYRGEIPKNGTILIFRVTQYVGGPSPSPETPRYTRWRSPNRTMGRSSSTTGSPSVST